MNKPPIIRALEGLGMQTTLVTVATQRSVEADSSRAPLTCSVPGVIFAVSNDGGKTGVAWREDIHEAFRYLDLQNVNGGDYAVIAVRKAPNAVVSDRGQGGSDD